MSQENANLSFQKTIGNPYLHDKDYWEKYKGRTLDDLKAIISDFTGNKNEPLFKRVSSRLIHLSNRINLLKAEDDEEDREKKNLLYLLLNLEAALDMKISNPTSIPTQISPPTNVLSHPKLFVATYKWNIHFRGPIQKNQ